MLKVAVAYAYQVLLNVMVFASQLVIDNAQAFQLLINVNVDVNQDSPTTNTVVEELVITDAAHTHHSTYSLVNASAYQDTFQQTMAVCK